MKLPLTYLPLHTVLEDSRMKVILYQIVTGTIEKKMLTTVSRTGYVNRKKIYISIVKIVSKGE